MKQLILKGFLILTIIKTATAIDCYVCNATDSASPFQCGEFFDRYDTPAIKPQSCSNVHGARYCIKHVGRYEVLGIKCYQCSAADTMSCSDLLIKESTLQPEECDHVFEAEYCIKSTSLYGGIGAKRYCSSKDLGNYCNYVQNRGDQMEYRSCLYTCDTDGCNTATNTNFNSLVLSIPLVLGYIANQLFN